MWVVGSLSERGVIVCGLAEELLISSRKGLMLIETNEPISPVQKVQSKELTEVDSTAQKLS